MTMDPAPENVVGEVVHRHSFEHRIEWGHVALAAAGIVIVVTLFGSDSVSVGESDIGSDTESDTGRIGG
jgi:hypothetical protein